MTIFGVFLEMGKNGVFLKMPKIDQNPKNGKNGVFGEIPQN
jgi:hypothetical protein